jgi:hypothetical protein
MFDLGMQFMAALLAFLATVVVLREKQKGAVVLVAIVALLLSCIQLSRNYLLDESMANDGLRLLNEDLDHLKDAIVSAEYMERMDGTKTALAYRSSEIASAEREIKADFNIYRRLIPHNVRDAVQNLISHQQTVREDLANPYLNWKSSTTSTTIIVRSNRPSIRIKTPRTALECVRGINMR